LTVTLTRWIAESLPERGDEIRFSARQFTRIHIRLFEVT